MWNGVNIFKIRYFDKRYVKLISCNSEWFCERNLKWDKPHRGRPSIQVGYSKWNFLSRILDKTAFPPGKIMRYELSGGIEGDSGHPLEPWLMTPILHAELYTPEQRCTDWHCKCEPSQMEEPRCLFTLPGQTSTINCGIGNVGEVDEAHYGLDTLILAPFTRPPQVVFRNISVGSTFVKKLAVLNPSKQVQRITLDQSLPPGLVIHLPGGECLEVEPETCVCVAMQWTPTQLVSKRVTIRFTNNMRGRHDVIVVMKSIVPTKSQNNQVQNRMTSPGKIKKNASKRSPVKEIYKKQSKILQHIDVEKAQPGPSNVLKPSDKQPKASLSEEFGRTFTLKSVPSKNDKLDKYPPTIEMDFHDSVDIKNGNKENETYTIICGTSSQQPTKPDDLFLYYLSVIAMHSNDTQVIEKKMPNTSSPKGPDTPNFTIHLDISRISNSSFIQQSLITEIKMLPKINNETIIYDGKNNKFSSDTYTIEEEFTERNMPEQYPWHSDLRADVRSPPRSLAPPLQSIPEKIGQFSETYVLKRTDNKHAESQTVPVNGQSTWSKRAVRAEPKPWKIPAPITKNPTKRKASVTNKESRSNKIKQSIETNRTINDGKSNLNYVGNVYSQCSTANPFLSSTYYYDKDTEALEKEFKRWLNSVLTPPADMASNVEQKIDVGKAWIGNRNKEVPLAPTKEQVCSAYHDSHRLKSLRRSARALLRSPEMTQVVEKLQLQFEKKKIAVRNDKNLHLDIGHQKRIITITLSYNPLWLRIGLEAIYDRVLLLKSNSDIEALSMFVGQQLFKNPVLKNKNSKTSAPMLQPTYTENIKKIFILVFFLDQAKQKKIIPHDPCLFRRNALYKDSKAILINLAKELISGIGDITKHLRPIGYVVSHKQSCLDEYIFAVQNIAVDLRDGVRLTKVMEIILMRRGLLDQLRTPATSRLQKIHNVQVALNALKEADFVILGDITAEDIVNGHKEKTLSLLWQLIQVFRAPLFEKSANVIQVWWRKKYEVIVEKRKEQQRLLERRNTAASIIQIWWRRNRMLQHKRTTATIVLQKYCRMWLCRRRFKKLKSSAAQISEWYINLKLKRQAIEALQILRSERELRRHSATLIQAYVKRWLCIKRYKTIKRKVIVIQSAVRQFLAHKQYTRLKSAIIFVQRKYRGKLLMRKEMQNLTLKRNSAILIQSYYRMSRLRKHYQRIKKSVLTIEKYYEALVLMRNDRAYYLKLKEVTIKVQACCRRNKVRKEYLRQRNLIVNMQRRIRASLEMKKDRKNYLKIRNAATIIQNHTRAYQAMKTERTKYILQRNSAIVIQRHYRAYLQMKTQRGKYMLLRKCVVQVQIRYRRLLAMRRERTAYLTLRNSVLTVQKRYRAKILMRETLNEYQVLKKATLVLQRRFRALLEMREERLKYIKMKSACITIQKAFRAYLQGKNLRQIYLRQKDSAIRIQRWYRSLKKTQEIKTKQRPVLKLPANYDFENRKENVMQLKDEEQRRNWAASKIQALFVGHKARKAAGARAAELRRRWREGALRSQQESLRERNTHALRVLSQEPDAAQCPCVLRAVKSLELLTEVMPALYDDNASSLARAVCGYMPLLNRSPASLKLLESVAAVLVNLTRYRLTGPNIYARDLVTQTIKIILKFKSEEKLLCILCTHLWLFAKYQTVKQDLTELLHMTENHKMLVAIKANVKRLKTMEANRLKSNSHSKNPSHYSTTLPALEPDYGIVRIVKPRYFQDSQTAINQLFKTYSL